MRYYIQITLCLALLLGLSHPIVSDQSEATPSKKTVYVFKIDEEIAPPAWRVVKKAVKEAQQIKADYILLHLNTYGGLVHIADSIRTLLLKTTPTTLVFIDKNAASAGALISIACDSIYMTKGASIGAATVVNQTGQAMPDKYQSYMRATMRSTAEAQGRDPRIAEAMVDQSIYVQGISDSGKVLTFTTSEALQHGYCEGEANSIDEVLKLAHVDHYEIVRYQPSSLDQIVGFFLNPVVNSLLLMIMFFGLYMELQSPGLGFPGMAALAAALLYFSPLYLEGLAQNWEILVFLVGLALIALELFVIPGFGVSGISGITLVFAALLLSLIRNDVFDFTFVSSQDLLEALFRVVVPLAVGLIVLFIFGGSFMKTPAFQRLVLKDTQESSEGFTTAGKSYEPLIGKTGVTITRLNPAGKVEVENELYDAEAEWKYVEKGEKVKVIEVKSNYLIVEQV